MSIYKCINIVSIPDVNNDNIHLLLYNAFCKLPMCCHRYWFKMLYGRELKNNFNSSFHGEDIEQSNLKKFKHKKKSKFTSFY